MRCKDMFFIAGLCFLSAVFGVVVGKRLLEPSLFAKLPQREWVQEKAWEEPATDFIDGVKVVATSPTDKQILKYDGLTDNRWELGSDAGLTECIMVGDHNATTGVTTGETVLYKGPGDAYGALIDAQVPMPRAGNLKNMRLRTRVTTASAGGGGIATYTVVKNGTADATLQVTISTLAAAEISGEDLVGSIAFVAGDLFCVKLVIPDDNVACVRYTRISFEYE